MKLFQFAILLSVLLPVGCGRKYDEHGHDHHKEKTHSHHDGHSHDEPASGASFTPGKGVILSEETRRSLGVETVQVTERKVPLELRFTAQVFGENHKQTTAETHHAECTAKAAGLIALDKAIQVRRGQPVQIATKAGESFGGVVLGVEKALAIGDGEVLIGVTNSGARLKPGEFFSVTVSIPRTGAMTAIPRSAVLRSAEGNFVYKQNGDAYLRTAIKTNAEAEGFVEVTDGLRTGDIVVSKPVEKLWLIELRATKGGGHAH